jgi:hypothetical protein
VHVRWHRNGGSHEIQWISRGQIRVWSSMCKDKTAQCSVNCPKGAAARDGLADGKVRLHRDSVPHDEVYGVLSVG